MVPFCKYNLKYIGQTSKSLEIGINQHRDAVRLGQVNNAVYKHIGDMNHAIDWNSSRLVCKSGFESHKLTVESVLLINVLSFNYVQTLANALR